MIEELKKFPLFSSCADVELRELLQSPHRRKECEAGRLVIRAGDPCRSLMLLSEGTVEACMGGDNGREVVIKYLDAPAILAPAFLFADDNTIPVEVSMHTNGIVWHIDKEGFFNFMTKHPHVLRIFLQTISARSRFLSEKVKGFAVNGLRERVMEHIRRHGAITNVTETAKLLGVARPSLSRILADLQAEGLVERTKEGGYVRNPRSSVVGLQRN